MRHNYLAIGIILIGTLIAVAAGPVTTTLEADLAAPVASDTLGTRPLRFLMVGLGQDMSRISDGLWHEDYEMIRQGARGVADHPRVMPKEMAAIKAALEGRFESFVGFDQLVHHTADELAEAAEMRDMQRVLDLQSRLQQGCISCHAAFRSEVRQALYGSPEQR